MHTRIWNSRRCQNPFDPPRRFRTGSLPSSNGGGALAQLADRLGAFTSIYSRKGVGVIGRGPAITTGNLLTAGTTFGAMTRVT